jgi:RNA polymerase sigma-70 factor (ECF subfamily)
LTRLYEEHSDAVFRYATRRLASREDAEDVLVEVYTVAWRRRTVVPEQALPWLYRTAANTIAHVVRSDARRGRLQARLTAVTELYAEDRLPDPDMAVALQRLAPADAEILRLWAWEGLEPQEIATVLDTSPGAARTRLSRAKARLREHFESGQEVGS